MITRVAHTAIIVKDLDEALDFYASVFNFKLRIRGENDRIENAFIFLEDQPDMELELIKDKNPSQAYAQMSIVNHVAFIVEDIEESIINLKSKNLIFKGDTPNIAIDGAKTIFLTGPNGESLQLVEPKK